MRALGIWLTGIMALCAALVAPAAAYDSLLFRAQASIFPKIILLDKDVASKVDNNEVVISIVHLSKDWQSADMLKNIIENQHPNGIGPYKLSVQLTDFDKISRHKVSTAYIILTGPAALQSSVTSLAAESGRLCFSYNYKDLPNDALVSLVMKEKTYIYLNKRVVAHYDIRFMSSFYKIVKVLE